MTTHNPNYVPEDQPAEQPRQITRRLLFDTEKQQLVEPSLGMVTMSKSIKVRKGGQRKMNKLHAGIFVVIAVDKYGK
jgi:hypothetical protein